MPGEYLKGFPDPPNSPNEKFLLPSTPHLWQDDLYRDLINNGTPHELALAISRSIAQHEDRKALVEQHQRRELEWWANIHTHPGGATPSGTFPYEPENFFWLTADSSGIYRISALTGMLVWEDTSVDAAVESNMGMPISPHPDGGSFAVLLYDGTDLELVIQGAQQGDRTSLATFPSSTKSGVVHHLGTRILVGNTGDNTLYCINALTGAVVWSSDFSSIHSSRRFFSIESVDSSTVIIWYGSTLSSTGNITEYLVTVNLIDGSFTYLESSANSQGRYLSISEDKSFATVVQFNGSDFFFRNFLLNDPEIDFIETLKGSNYILGSQNIIYLNNQIILGHSTRVIRCYDLTQAETILWTHQLSNNSGLGSNDMRALTRSPDGSKLYALCKGSTVEIDLETGVLEWEHAIGGDYGNSRCSIVYVQNLIGN